jgi:hypothetical protein
LGVLLAKGAEFLEEKEDFSLGLPAFLVPGFNIVP